MFEIYLNDTNIPYEQANDYFSSAADWAKKQCPSFVEYHVQDVSDVSYTNDFIAEYKFRDQKDSMWFNLKWQK
jgi:hypothetical protein